jgi:threonine synthase
MIFMRIICSDCSEEVPMGTLGRCPRCDGILRPEYPAQTVATLATLPPGPGLDRYRALLPVTSPIPFLGEGDTPLVRSRRLGAALGLENLYFKNEGRNPSGAFKDRAAATAVALAKDGGATGLLTASSGNAASALSAYCAAAGIHCLILLEPGNPPNKIRQSLATGARVLPVQGIFARGPAALRRLLGQVAEQLNYYLGFVWAPVNPYILEGIKTIAYEVAARLPGAPDVVVAPVGGGDMFAAQWRGYLELKTAGVIDHLPRMIGVQSHNAPPLLRAFEAHDKKVTSLPTATSNISGINVAFTGEHALNAVYESNGAVAGMADEEAVAMQRRIAREEGVWVEPAAAATVAALPRLLAEGRIKAADRIVCVFSGAGFKESHLAEDDATALTQQTPVAFEVDAIVAAGR